MPAMLELRGIVSSRSRRASHTGLPGCNACFRGSKEIADKCASYCRGWVLQKLRRKWWSSSGTDDAGREAKKSTLNKAAVLVFALEREKAFRRLRVCWQKKV